MCSKIQLRIIWSIVKSQKFPSLYRKSMSLSTTVIRAVPVKKPHPHGGRHLNVDHSNPRCVDTRDNQWVQISRCSFRPNPRISEFGSSYKCKIPHLINLTLLSLSFFLISKYCWLSQNGAKCDISSAKVATPTANTSTKSKIFRCYCVSNTTIATTDDANFGTDSPQLLV